MRQKTLSNQILQIHTIWTLCNYLILVSIMKWNNIKLLVTSEESPLYRCEAPTLFFSSYISSRFDLCFTLFVCALQNIIFYTIIKNSICTQRHSHVVNKHTFTCINSTIHSFKVNKHLCRRDKKIKADTKISPKN